MKWKEIFLGVLLVSCHIYAECQNLVYNGGFEEVIENYDFRFRKMTKEIGESTDVKYWGAYCKSYSRERGEVSSEYFPRTGKYCLYLHVYGLKGKRYTRSYIISKLKHPLVADKKYYFSFYVKRVKCGIAVDRIGGALLDTIVLPKDYRKNCYPLDYEPQIENERGGILESTEQYNKISDTIVASGGEQFIVIGNFRSSGKTRIKEFPNERPKDSRIGAYLVDDVSVIPLANNLRYSKSNSKIDTFSKFGTIKSPNQSISNKSTFSEIHRYSFYFKFDTTSFAKKNVQYNKKLKNISDTLNSNTHLYCKIVGYTDTTGNREYNTRLALKRASRIGEILEGYGIPNDRIEVISKGEEAREFVNAHEARRVDVILFRK